MAAGSPGSALGPLPGNSPLDGTVRTAAVGGGANPYQRMSRGVNMKTSVGLTVAGLLAAAVGMHGSCLAGENGTTKGPGGILGALSGSAVPAGELSGQHARGIKNINIDTNNTVESGSLNSGALRGNAVIGTSDTGTITTSGSINNNTGFTTVFQNSGNNSLFQQSTSIYITVH